MTMYIHSRKYWLQNVVYVVVNPCVSCVKFNWVKRNLFVICTIFVIKCKNWVIFIQGFFWTFEYIETWFSVSLLYFNELYIFIIFLDCKINISSLEGFFLRRNILILHSNYFFLSYELHKQVNFCKYGVFLHIFCCVYMH